MADSRRVQNTAQKWSNKIRAVQGKGLKSEKHLQYCSVSSPVLSCWSEQFPVWCWFVSSFEKGLLLIRLQKEYGRMAGSKQNCCCWCLLRQRQSLLSPWDIEQGPHLDCPSSADNVMPQAPLTLQAEPRVWAGAEWSSYVTASFFSTVRSMQIPGPSTNFPSHSCVTNISFGSYTLEFLILFLFSRIDTSSSPVKNSSDLLDFPSTTIPKYQRTRGKMDCQCLQYCSGTQWLRFKVTGRLKCGSCSSYGCLPCPCDFATFFVCSFC